jgi:tetratricopeptide (TPR) repeat protein
MPNLLKRRILMLGLAGLCLLPVPLFAETGDAGTEGPFALGRAYTGVAGDASAIYWNPGALAYLEKKEIASLYVPLAEGIDYGFLSFAYPISVHETLALGFMGLSVRGIPKTDALDNDLGETSDTQFQVLLSYSRVWWKALGGGINAKLYRHILDTYNGTGIGADAGLFYDFAAWIPGLTAGLTLTNAVAPRITLSSQADTYPLNTRLGAAYRLGLDRGGNHQVMASLEGEKSDFTDWRLHAGAEYLAFKLLSLRAGWDRDMLTAGAGIQHWDLRLDYALTLKNDFGNLHYVTLGWRFGPSLSEEAMKQRRDILNELAQMKFKEYNRRGLDHMKQGQYEQALDEFQVALSWVESSPETTYYLEQAKAGLAREKIKQSFQQGEKAYAGKHYLDALTAWREVAKQDPKYPGLQKMVASAQQALIQQEMPSPKRQKGIQESQELFRAGLMAYTDEKYAQAAESWEKALSLNPSQYAIRSYLDKARRHLTRASEKATPTPATQEEMDRTYEQGLQYYRQKKFEEARRLWTKVLQLNPGHAGARRGVERIDAILQVLQERGIKE